MNDLIASDNFDSDEEFRSFCEAVRAIQQPRTEYELRHFVVGRHDSTPRQWHQCTLEMQNKGINIRRAEISGRKTRRRIEYLTAKGNGTPFDLEAKKRADALDDAELAKLGLAEQELAEIGAKREFAALREIWKSFGRTYTRQEIDAAEAEHWRSRLTRQANQDIEAHGRIMVGNQDALRMAGMESPVVQERIKDVEKRFLEQGNVKILVVVPTLIPQETIRRDGLRCLNGWDVPGTIQRKNYVVVGKSTADAYTDAALTAMQDGADFLLCVEDDHVIPAGTFERLWSVYQQHGPRAIAGAWYPQKREPRTGAAIVLRGGKREYLDCEGIVDGQHVVEVYAITQGFTLIPTAIFRELPQPWFQTTGCLTQDAFFSQLAREAGYKLLVDTGARIKHVDRETGRVFE